MLDFANRLFTGNSVDIKGIVEMSFVFKISDEKCDCDYICHHWQSGHGFGCFQWTCVFFLQLVVALVDDDLC